MISYHTMSQSQALVESRLNVDYRQRKYVYEW